MVRLQRHLHPWCYSHLLVQPNNILHVEVPCLPKWQVHLSTAPWKISQPYGHTNLRNATSTYGGCPCDKISLCLVHPLGGSNFLSAFSITGNEDAVVYSLNALFCTPNLWNVNPTTGNDTNQPTTVKGIALPATFLLTFVPLLPNFIAVQKAGNYQSINSLPLPQL